MKYIVQSVNEKIPEGVTRVAPFMFRNSAERAVEIGVDKFIFVTPEEARADVLTKYFLIPVEE